MGTVTRRPLPALIALVALLVLTAIVWVRVLNRDGKAGATASGTPCPTKTVAASLPNPADVDVLVLNSTKRNGIAASARRTLQAAGFNSTKPAGNDPSKVKVTGVAQIRYGPLGRGGATLLRYYFPGATAVGSTKITTGVVTIALGAKYTAVASGAAVRAALAKAGQATSSAPAPSTTPSAGASGSLSARPSPTC